ncbi:MAG: hypothetical protein JWQ71_2029, partial [Pedosphaera sp.]|nr:hypothetical protein [Pedosphaera sp.]
MQSIRHSNRSRAWAWCLLFITVASLSVAAPPPKDLSFLENPWIKLGVRTNAGACIAYFSFRSLDQNVINDYDLGRFIQQSYYGRPDGSTWAGKPWKWNPVQGGSHDGKPSTLVTFSNNGKTIYAKTIPRHWATGADTPNVAMEEWIMLQDKLVRIHYKMTYTGTVDHPPEQQELPAVFLNPSCNTLAYYKGSTPWEGLPLARRHPLPTNEHDAITENWAAYLNQLNWGMGVYVPGVTNMTF